MRFQVPLVSVGVITGLLGLACAGGPSSSIRGKSYGPGPHDPGALAGAYVVPPDRSLHAVTLAATGPTAAAAGDQIRADLKALKLSVDDEAACTVRIQGYAPPTAGDWNGWSARGQAVLDVDLTDASDPLARMDRLDLCRSLLLPLLTDGSVDVPGQSDREHAVALYGGTFHVDDPQQHLQTLLDQRAQHLAVAAAGAGAPQLHPEDFRCVPTGQVHTGAARIEGVALTADIQCRIDEVPQAQAVASVVDTGSHL